GAIGLLLRLHALTDRADDGGMDRLVRIAEGHQHSTGQDDGQYDVHGRAAAHDDALLPPRLAVVHAVFVAVPRLISRGVARVPGHGLEQPGAGLAQLAVFAAGLGREHPDHAHVSAERDRLDAVLGLTSAAREDRAPEADHVL